MVTDMEPVLDPKVQQIAPRGRILVVDDDHSQAEILSLCLSKQGYLTATAHTVREGLDAAFTHTPDAILMDIRLPDGSGLDACAQLSDDPRTCAVPVIVLSGMERPDIVRRSRAAGCQYYLRKPYDPNALLLLVESATGTR